MDNNNNINNNNVNKYVNKTVISSYKHFIINKQVNKYMDVLKSEIYDKIKNINTDININGCGIKYKLFVQFIDNLPLVKSENTEINNLIHKYINDYKIYVMNTYLNESIINCLYSVGSYLPFAIYKNNPILKNLNKKTLDN